MLGCRAFGPHDNDAELGTRLAAAGPRLAEEVPIYSKAQPESQQSRPWLLSVLVWDGMLPALVFASPRLLAACLPGAKVLANLLSCLMVPVVAALLRADAGHWQLLAITKGKPGLVRQFLLAGAIVLLLLSEALAAAFQCRGNVPIEGWLAVVVIYLIYLVLIILALRRPPLDHCSLWPGYGRGFDDVG